MKEQSRLHAESKEIQLLKKKCMDRIMQLTPEVFEKNDEDARKEMQACEKEIKRINERAGQIEKKLEEIPDAIREANIELLEHIVNVVYFKMRKHQKRASELEKLIEETRSRLKEYIDEKESLSQDGTDIYSYFHDLLGGEELERLDKQFFNEE